MLVLLAGVLAAGRPSAYVQPVSVVDEGTFTHYVNGARVGEERFRISEERGGTDASVLRAAGELNLKLEGHTIRVRVALEATGATPVPRRYEADINDTEARTIVGVLVRDRLRLTVRSPLGQELKQFLVRGRAVVLDHHVAHHYFLAARHLGRRDTAQVSIFIPQRSLQTSGQISDLGEESVQVGGRNRRLRHLRVTTTGGSNHDVWLAGDRVMKVQIPADGWTAVRSDSAGLVPSGQGGLR